MIKWKLMITTLPVAILVMVIRFLLEHFFMPNGKEFNGLMDFSVLSPILTGGVFLIGLMMSGTLSDYKESEKLPGELACCLEAMEETIDWAAASKPAFNPLPSKQVLASVTADLLAWLYRKRSHAESFASLEKLNKIVQEIDKQGPVGAPSRFLGDIYNLRKFVTRIGVISRTGFLASGYALLDVLVSAILVLVSIATYKSEFGTVGKYMLIAFISLIYTYMWRLIRDLDDPFEYVQDGGQAGAAEIELFPIIEYQERAKARLRSVESNANPRPDSIK